MRWLALVMFCVLLSGCTSSGGLGTYLMKSSEVPEGCSLLPYNSEEGDFLRESFNWTGNPGRVDNEILSDDGVTPVDNLVGLYECEEGEIATIALRYASAEDVQVIAEDPDCGDPEERAVTNGPIVAFVEGDSEVPGMEDSLDTWALRVVRQTGAQDPCAPTGNMTA